MNATTSIAVLDWLLDSDPAIRWQTLRDLSGAPAEVVATERARVATEGWGARLLALRDHDGLWEGGAVFPAPGWVRNEGQPWTATEPTLTLLRAFGIDPGSETMRRAEQTSAAEALKAAAENLVSFVKSVPKKSG